MLVPTDLTRPAIRRSNRPGFHANNWSAEELAILRTHYPVLPQAELMALLPARTTWICILNKAVKMKIRRPAYARYADGWSPAELAILTANYPTVGVLATLALLPGRSRQATRQRAHHLGLSAANMRTRAVKPAKLARVKVEKVAKVRAVKPAKVAKVKVEKPVLVQPTRRPIATPVLNKQKAFTKARAEPRAVLITAADLRALAYEHPARMAYSRAAHLGGVAAQAAYHAAMKQLGPC